MPPTEELSCPRCAGPLERLPNGQLACGYCGWEGPVPAPPPDAGARIETAVTLPFRVAKADAVARMGEWLGKGWFRPSDLQATAVLERIRALHVPAVRVRVDAESSWSGYDTRTEYRTVTTTETGPDGKPKQVTKQEPHTVRDYKSGTHVGQYEYWLPLAGSVSYAELLRLGDWDTDPGSEPAAAEPDEVVPPQWNLEQLRSQISELVNSDEASACLSYVENLEETITRWHIAEQAYFFLPIWSLAYRYRDRLWHVFVNGQSGEIAGHKPVSGAKVALVVVGVVVLIGIGWLLWHLLAR